jgi:hypothetical protein
MIWGSTIRRRRPNFAALPVRHRVRPPSASISPTRNTRLIGRGGGGGLPMLQRWINRGCKARRRCEADLSRCKPRAPKAFSRGAQHGLRHSSRAWGRHLSLSSRATHRCAARISKLHRREHPHVPPPPCPSPAFLSRDHAPAARTSASSWTVDSAGSGLCTLTSRSVSSAHLRSYSRGAS